MFLPKRCKMTRHSTTWELLPVDPAAWEPVALTWSRSDHAADLLGYLSVPEDFIIYPRDLKIVTPPIRQGGLKLLNRYAAIDDYRPPPPMPDA